MTGGVRPNAGRKNEIMDPVNVDIRFPKEDIANVDAVAQELEVSRGEVIRKAVTFYLRSRKTGEAAFEENQERIAAFIRSEYIPAYKEYVRPYRKSAESAVSQFPDFEPHEVLAWRMLRASWKDCQFYLGQALGYFRYAERNLDDPTIYYTLSCIPESLERARECLVKTKD